MAVVPWMFPSNLVWESPAEKYDNTSRRQRWACWVTILCKNGFYYQRRESFMDKAYSSQYARLRRKIFPFQLENYSCLIRNTGALELVRVKWASLRRFQAQLCWPYLPNVWKVYGFTTSGCASLPWRWKSANKQIGSPWVQEASKCPARHIL